MRVTVKDIAKIAGVTQPTVSKALNNEPGVSEQTRMRILTIAKELNYVPNLAAKRLVQRKSDCIGLVWPRAGGLFHFRLAQEIQQEVTRRGYTFLISVADPAVAVHTFNDHFVDRILFWEAPGWVPSLEFVKEKEAFQGKIVVMGGARLEGAHRIQIDRQQGFYTAMKHLAELGHRKVSYIGYLNDKYAGFMQGMVEFRMEHHPDYFIRRDERTRLESEAELLAMLTRPKEERVTAIIVDSQGTLFRIQRYFRKLGIRIPDDMSLISYDNIPEMTTLLEVPLTVIGPSIQQLVTTALDMLIGDVDGQDSDKREDLAKLQPDGSGTLVWQDVVMEPELVIRESTQPVPKP